MQLARNGALDKALRYADIGLKVIPLHDRSKIPRIRRWQQQASCDPRVIQAWFRRWPGGNLGLLTGDGLIAVDIDPAKGGVESFKKLWGRRRMPATAVAHTGSGGYHYLFRVAPGIRIGNRAGLLPGLDVRGDGGQIVVEPSVHPATGRRYRWIYGPEQGIAQAPRWLVRRLLEGGGGEGGPPDPPAFAVRPGLAFGRRGDVGELTADIVARFPITARGQRNDLMVRAVGRLLGRGYDPDLVHEAVVAWWRQFHDLGVVGTPPAEAPKAVRACIEYTLANPEFRQSTGADHRARVAAITLDESQKALINRGVVNPDTQTLLPLTSNRVTQGRPLCVTSSEQAFVESLVAYFTYKVLHLGERAPKGTREQIRRDIEGRRGIVLDNQQFERLKRKYIAREGRPATRCELAVQTAEGRQGVPSEFRLTGLLQLLPEGSPHEDQGPRLAAA